MVETLEYLITHTGGVIVFDNAGWKVEWSDFQSDRFTRYDEGMKLSFVQYVTWLQSKHDQMTCTIDWLKERLVSEE